jgi:hypothetical protein
MLRYPPIQFLRADFFGYSRGYFDTYILYVFEIWRHDTRCLVLKGCWFKETAKVAWHLDSNTFFTCTHTEVFSFSLYVSLRSFKSWSHPVTWHPVISLHRNSYHFSPFGLYHLNSLGFHSCCIISLLLLCHNKRNKVSVCEAWTRIGQLTTFAWERE